jgi:hypothetical protein
MAAQMLHLRSMAPAALAISGLDSVCEAGYGTAAHPGMDVYWYERDTPVGITVLLGMTIVLQLMAAVLVLRLIRGTAQRTA